jgi:hypothetical protein
MSSVDLKHRDWLIRTQAKMVQQNTPNVKTKVIHLPKDRRLLQLSNISKLDLFNLKIIY